MFDQPPILCKIRNFVEFLESSLERKVIEYVLSPITKPGDNYGAVVQSVDVKVAGTNNSEELKNSFEGTEVLHLVAKTAVTNPYLVEIFQPAFTFVKEAHFYSDIIPAIEHFERISNVPEREKIDAFIRCFGSRISLEHDAKCADADAVVLLENTKVQNYSNGDRQIGFNTEATVAVLKSLAKFHALGIAMRRLQPNLFDARVRPHLEAVNLILNDNDTQMVDSVCKELHFIESLEPKLRIAIQKQLKICYEFTRNVKRATDTPFTTVVHRDLWINNIMIMKDANVGIKVKIYDFQLYFYQTFVCDLILFLFTSVCCTDLSKNFKTFIHVYHSEFTKTLELVNCPLDDYTFEKMWKEIRTNAKIEMLHVLFMSKLAMADGAATSSIDEISTETFYKEEPPSKAVLKRWKFIIDMFTENDFL